MSDIKQLKSDMVEYIKTYMLINNLDQLKLAEETGVYQTAISKVVRDKTGVYATFDLYTRCGGELFGAKESRARIVEEHLAAGSKQ